MNLAELFPNVCVSFGILLSMSTTVASGERSFIGMKRMRNFGRSAMSREKLNEPIMFYMISDIVWTIYFTTIIEEFAKK
jgi:hypothetical protein